jgi:hypothetical protein
MDYLSSVKELRKRVPISITEAIELLKKHNNDIELCEQIFKDNNILEICRETNCSEEIAKQRYVNFKFDIARTIQSIREELYDKQYKEPDFLTYEKLDILTREKLDVFYEWLRFENYETFETALVSYGFETIIDILKQMENLTQVYIALKTARERLDIYMEEKDGSVKDYVGRVNALRTDKVYCESQEVFELNRYLLERELDRHDRNVDNEIRTRIKKQTNI